MNLPAHIGDAVRRTIASLVAQGYEPQTILLPRPLEDEFWRRLMAELHPLRLTEAAPTEKRRPNSLHGLPIEIIDEPASYCLRIESIPRNTTEV